MVMKNLFRSWALLSAITCAEGCATLISGTTQEVRIQADHPCTYRIEALNEAGHAPCTAILPRGTDCTIAFTGDGVSGTAHLRRHLNPWIFGNLFLGGVIGFVIDFVNGSAWTYDERVVATLRSTGEESAPPPDYTSAEPPPHGNVRMNRSVDALDEAGRR